MVPSPIPPVLTSQRGLATMLVVGALLAGAIFSGTSASAAASSDTLSAGQTLNVNEYIQSSDGRYKAIMQGDGNFVVYGPTGARWNTGAGAARYITMQTDGNLVSYSPSGKYQFSSSTAPAPAARLVMQSDGNLVIYSRGSIALWASGSLLPDKTDTLSSGSSLNQGVALWSINGQYDAIMQGDGNFVVYGPNGPTWNTGGGAARYISMQTDGNLVSYSPSGKYQYSSSTAPSSGDRLVMQGDGNLVIYDGGGRALWSNGNHLGPATGGPSVPYGTCYQVKSRACIDDEFGYTGQRVWSYPVDAWGNNCTNYVAFRLSQNGASNPGNLGNASSWANSARAKGIRVDGIPAVGSIAQWGTKNHVAYVDWVSSDGSKIAVSESGYHLSDSVPSMSGRSVINRNGPSSKGSPDSTWPDTFIHLKDIGR